MKYRTLALVVLFFYAGALLAQTQVSDIEYFLKRDDYPRKGFLSLDTTEYFIEQGVEGTTISLVKDDGLEVIHNLKHRPTDSSIKYYVYSNCYDNSNSGLIYEGKNLYELYWDYIYVVDILTGDLQEVVDLKSFDLRLQSNFVLGGSYYSFNALGETGSYSVRYDRLTSTMKKVDFQGLRLGPNVYQVNATSDSIIYYNYEQDTILSIPYQFSEIHSLSELFVGGVQSLIVRDAGGVFVVQDNDVVKNIICSIPEELSILAISGDRLICADVGDVDMQLVVVDGEICQLNDGALFPDLNLSNFVNYNFEELNDEYLLFGYSSDWQGIGKYYLYNIETNQYAVLDMLVDFFDPRQAIRYGSKLYIVGIDEIHYLGHVSELYEIDLDDFDVNRISDFTFTDIRSVVIGEEQDDLDIHVYYQIEQDGSLYSLETESGNLNEVNKFDILNDHGIYQSIYTDVWSHGNYFFSTSAGVFVLHEDVVTKLLDLGPNSLASSSFLSLDDYVFVLASLDSEYYALKIHATDLTITKKWIPELEKLHYSRINTGNAIVILDGGNVGGYYDVWQETYFSFDDLGVIEGKGRAVSGDNILIHTGGSWYVHNTVTKVTHNLKINSGTFLDPYPDGQGGFYMDGWNSFNPEDFFHIDEKGTSSTVIEGFSYQLFYKGNRFDGNVKSLAFDGVDSMIILSVKDGDVRVKHIPDGGLLYYMSASYFWYESDNRSFLEIKNGSLYDTYTFTFDTEPVKITEQSRDDRLIFVIEDTDKAVLVYKDKNNVISFYDYIYSSGEWLKVTSMQSVSNGSYLVDVLTVNESERLVFLHDGVHGLEPWIYNLDIGTIELLKDINEKFTSSNPDDFMYGPDGDIYFSSLVFGGDRQLFKINNGISQIHHVNHDFKSALIVFPSPTTGYIQLIGDQEALRIFNVNGQIVFEDSDYKSLELINLNHLSGGIYLIEATSSLGIQSETKFVISRD
ncbi:MAG: T9SS type A sorting domain-containing protein [Saprospiraceae bacterium]